MTTQILRSFFRVPRPTALAALTLSGLLLVAGCETTQTSAKDESEHVITGGKIGVGTWSTRAEFKDIYVVHDGVGYPCPIPDDLSGWKTRRGTWKVVDGALRQTSLWEDTRAILTGEIPWTNYTLALKARKLGGSEGFLIYFGMTSVDAHYLSRWNIGGWSNTFHALQVEGVEERRFAGHIEDNRWYDIRVEFNDGVIRTYLDDELIQTAGDS